MSTKTKPYLLDTQYGIPKALHGLPLPQRSDRDPAPVAKLRWYLSKTPGDLAQKAVDLEESLLLTLCRATDAELRLADARRKIDVLDRYRQELEVELLNRPTVPGPAPDVTPLRRALSRSLTPGGLCTEADLCLFCFTSGVVVLAVILFFVGGFR